MIYTITFNPALDYIVKVNDFELGAVNRTYSEDIYAGGNKCVYSLKKLRNRK